MLMRARTSRLGIAAALLILSGVPSSADETLAVSGLREPVEILRDPWGVAHIYAKNQADLFFAQGFNVAHDRLFQLREVTSSVDRNPRRGYFFNAKVFQLHERRGRRQQNRDKRQP